MSPHTSDNLITPEYLLSKGFIKVTGDTDLPYNFPFGMDHAGETYIEKEFSRQMFGVNFYNMCDNPNDFDCTVCVQEDAGCGFIIIPCPFDWDIESFVFLYYALRRINLNTVNTKLVSQQLQLGK